MKRFLLLFAVLAISVSALADNLRSQIEATNKKATAALMKKDIDAFSKLIKGECTKDFKYLEGGRTMSFDEMISGMRMGMGQMSKVTKADAKITDLKQRGNTATCTSDHVMNGFVLDGQKNAHTLSFKGTSVETYRKEKGKWLLATMTWKRQETMLDGKKLPQTGG